MFDWIRSKILGQDLFKRYEVSIEFVHGIAGGTPLNPDLIKQHMKLFSEGVSNPLKYAMKVEGAVTEEAMEEHLKRASSGFPADAKGIFIRGFQINAMFKDAAQRMKATMKRKGLGNTIRDGGLHFPHKIYLGTEAIFVERPVKPDNGPANIKVFQVAEAVKLTFPCAVLNNEDLDDELFRDIWEVAQGVGLGSNRHLGYGLFRILSLEKVTNDKTWKVADLLSMEVLPETKQTAPKAKKAA